MDDPHAAPAEVLGGRYRLEEPVGRGGMSTVYRAIDTQLGRAVAVKVFHASGAEPGRQESELLVLAGLDHHALVNLFDAGVHAWADGRQSRFLVMALVTGSTLADRLLQTAIAPRHIAEIGYDMAEALEYIHAHGVIHRDIKPSNILLVDYGNRAQRARARLTDFGIALAEDVERMTAEGATTGTAAYLSPEQVAGSTVGPESDVYALGLVLLECFTRRVEFPGSIVESAIARLTRDPVVPAELPEHWRELLVAMTSRSPADRPTNGDLVAWLRQLVIIESGRHRDDPGVFPSAPALDGAVPDIFDTVPDLVLDRASALAARIMYAPLAAVSTIVDGRLRVKSYYGADIEELARDLDLEAVTAAAAEPVVVEDARVDPRLRDNPLVTGPIGLRFYVSVPLLRDGVAVGSLAVLNSVPGTVTERDLANLEDIAALVVGQLALGPRRTTGAALPFPLATGEARLSGLDAAYSTGSSRTTGAAHLADTVAMGIDDQPPPPPPAE